MPILPKNELRQLVAVACTDDALRQLLDLLAGIAKHRKVYDAMILLSGEWQDLDERIRLNLLTFKDSGPVRARINHAVLQYLNELPDEIEPPKAKTPAKEAMLRQTVQTIAADSDWEYDLFFSFSSRDIDSARDFCHRLRGHGLRVFFSADDLRSKAGHNFGDIIDKALRQSRDFLLFCSPNAMESRWVKIEHQTFFDNYHLHHEQVRGFYIAEGPDFHAELVPPFYRRIQRLLQPEDLLQSLAKNQVPSKKQVPKKSILQEPESESSKPAVAHAEELAWEFTTDAGDRAAYEKFLTKFPKGYYAGEARSRIEAFDADDIAWEFATHHANEKSIQKYLSKYPDGVHAAEARKLMADLELKREEEIKREAQRAKESDPFHELMIPIKGGTFQMGSNEYDSEKPPHQVTISDFLLCKYPVTQAQWKKIMGNNPSHFKGDDLPVESVSWYDVQDFLKKLNAQTGKKYRLPSEAEWEYAAKGGNQSKGFTYAGSNDLKEVGWYWENSGDKPLSGEWKSENITANNGRTHPLGQKKPNELGLYDMSGNVWEWCEDDFHGNYKGAPVNGAAWADNPRGSDRVLRGGSWDLTARGCRSACRLYWPPDYRFNLLGFRLALAPQFGG